MVAKGRRPRLLQFPFSFGMLLLVFLVGLIHQRHDFIMFEVEAFGVIPNNAVSFAPPSSLWFPKSVSTEKTPQTFSFCCQNYGRRESSRSTQLYSISSSAAYLDSISYQPPTVEDGLLGATSKYLDALSSVKFYTENCATNGVSSSSMFPASAGTVSHSSEDPLVHEIVQHVTREFSSTLDAFGGDAHNSFMEGSPSTILANVPEYLDLEETSQKTGRNLRVSVSNSDPGESLQELTSRLDATFQSFRDSLFSSNQQVTKSLRRNTVQSDAAITTANQHENFLAIQQKADEAVLTPETLDTVSQTTADAVKKSWSETASSANSALESVQKQLGSFVTNTNQGIEKAFSNVAESKSSVASSLSEAKAAAVSSAGTALAGGASSFKSSVGTTAASTKAAIFSAQPGTSATAGKVSAVALSASQGFGLQGHTYNGGGDVAGLLELVAATIVSIPRAIMDFAMMESNNANGMVDGMDHIMEDISDFFSRDILAPLSAPLQSVADTPLDKAQGVLQTLQMVLALVLGIPRVALEGLTGSTISEIEFQLSQADVRALAEQLSGFAGAVSSVLVSLLKVVAQAVGFVVDKTGLGSALVAGQEELWSKIVSFVVEDLLPTILDGILLILKQFAMLLLEGGSAIVGSTI